MHVAVILNPFPPIPWPAPNVNIRLAALLSSHAYLSLFTLLGSRSCFLMANETVIEQPLRLQNITSRFTHKAVDYIHARGADAQPFFLLVSYAKLHTGALRL